MRAEALACDTDTEQRERRRQEDYGLMLSILPIVGMFTSPTAESLRACSSRTISSIGRNASDKTSPTDSPKVTTEKRGSRRASLLRNKRISASKKNLLGSPKDTTGKLEGRPKLFPSRTSSSIRDLMQARKNSYLEKEVSAVSGSAISGSSA
eukprot:1379545-Amorphochlora_amoeboformis.AAC.1